MKPKKQMNLMMIMAFKLHDQLAIKASTGLYFRLEDVTFKLKLSRWLEYFN